MRLPDLTAALKACAEPTRLRILALVTGGDLAVKDLTEILGQSQPRISRHLKILAEARLVERWPEGSWVYYRLAEDGGGPALARACLDLLDPGDGVMVRDTERLAAVRAARDEAAEAYFAANAADWDHIRSLHVPEAAVEEAVRAMLGRTPFQALLDIGTGTGRMLVLLADLYARGVGIDASRDMLSIARANLSAAGIRHAHARLGDVYEPGVAAGSIDVVIVHQVLHFLADPARAIAAAARTLAPGGRLLIVDFAPHDLEFLREEHAHRRLGFSTEQIAGWIEAAGLEGAASRTLAPAEEGGGAAPKLTVNLWLACDPRVRVAA